jgi:dipeptidyl aminopeptidase/acylaminoacyl peptidase
VRPLRWQSADGLEIEGLLLVPQGDGPHPVVMNVHGGPVYLWRASWLGRFGIPFLHLLRQGMAVFLPNPRGSSGRGLAFAHRVVGDMGGRDTADYLTGLDHIVELGMADPTRLAVTGISYGGYMASWLVTQDQRFRAAVVVSPMTNLVTQHLLSNIPHFVEAFVVDEIDDLSGTYASRSPLHFARQVRTPTLLIAGRLDRCTPAVEAEQFYQALVRYGVDTELAVYPEEGHGIRKFPAVIDYTVRLAEWFSDKMELPRSTVIPSSSLQKARRVTHAIIDAQPDEPAV